MINVSRKRRALMAPTSAGQQMNQNNRDLWAVRRNTSNSHKLSLAISCCIHQTSCCVVATSYFNSKFMQNVCLCQQCFNGRMDGILVAESIFVEEAPCYGYGSEMLLKSNDSNWPPPNKLRSEYGRHQPWPKVIMTQLSAHPGNIKYRQDKKVAQGSRNEGGIKVVPADTGWSLTITAASVISWEKYFQLSFEGWMGRMSRWWPSESRNPGILSRRECSLVSSVPRSCCVTIRGWCILTSQAGTDSSPVWWPRSWPASTLAQSEARIESDNQ